MSRYSIYVMGALTVASAAVGLADLLIVEFKYLQLEYVGVTTLGEVPNLELFSLFRSIVVLVLNIIVACWLLRIPKSIDRKAWLAVVILMTTVLMFWLSIALLRFRLQLFTLSATLLFANGAVLGLSLAVLLFRRTAGAKRAT